MRGKKTLLAAAVVLAAALFATAEVALDEVVQAGRFVLYRDHADPHKYYYVPDAPRLATKRDGTPEFAFIKYSKTDGATKGGIIHFLVTWGFSEGELSSAESALRLKDPEARIAGPVPFKEGTFKVVSATAGEGGIFNRRIVGEGKAPIMPGQKAAVSIALTEEGASLLWESFKNPTSDISVMFALKFAGVTPAFQAKLKVNWDKVYTQHDIKLHAEGTIKVVKLQADVRAILEELRQKGAIQLEVVGENQDMQKMLDVVYGHLLSLMCEKVPMGPGEAASPPAKKRPAPAPEPVGDWPAGHPVWSTAVLAEVVRAADERRRGGPFVDQDQVQSQQAAAPPCDAQSREKAEELRRQSTTLLNAHDMRAGAEALKKAYDTCPDVKYLAELGTAYDLFLNEWTIALQYYEAYLLRAEFYEAPSSPSMASQRASVLRQVKSHADSGMARGFEGRHREAAEEYRLAYAAWRYPLLLFSLGASLKSAADQSGDTAVYQEALGALEEFVENADSYDDEVISGETVDMARQYVRAVRSALGPNAMSNRDHSRFAEQVSGALETPRRDDPGLSQKSVAEERRAKRQQAQSQTAETSKEQAQQQAQAGQAQATGAQQTTSTGGTGAMAAAGGKPPAGGQSANVAGGQAQQTTSTGQTVKPPDTTGGTKPPTGQTPAAKNQPQAPGTKPGASAPEVKPIVSVQVGYSFKRVKMSGDYEVDMRKRLREDRDIVMSGNIGGVYQKYGEDARFFSVVSLDDPTFQERSVEVILDGQDASDFKSYINAVSVLFRKQRFSGAPMTGEVKFVDQQFAQSGNRQSFKYGRLNEASTEWLDYEYKPKWSLYGGVEWEGEWTKTSDSVLTLSPPVRRRTLQISVDEDNIIKNGVKALAIQVKHTIYGKDILKEVVINYDKGDPLEADYTYMHEDGNLGYSYKVVWLFLDGREIHTEWMTKESPFIYAVFTKK
jgi:hypothetical protein